MSVLTCPIVTHDGTQGMNTTAGELPAMSMVTILLSIPANVPFPRIFRAA